MKFKSEMSLDGDAPVRVRDALIVGAGYAGRRFIEVIQHMQRGPAPIRLAGIVDKSPAVIVKDLSGTAHFTDLRDAFTTVQPDIAIVCVNEGEHHDVLRDISAMGVRAILCEKPLTASMAEAKRLEATLLQRFVSVNLVERHSPIVDLCRQWLSDRPRHRVRRIEFFWGKHRVRDSRPTIGAVSELIHPLDLVRYVFDLNSLRIRSAFGVTSDMHPLGPVVADSLSVLMTCEDCVIVGHGSFAWPRRDRRIVAFVGDGEELFRLTLQFDNPHWDCDQFVISRINLATGTYETVLEHACGNDDFPASLNGIYKVQRFVETSLAAMNGQPVTTPLVGVAEATELQAIIDEITEAGAFERAYLTT